jgi:hypothetical protein
MSRSRGYTMGSDRLCSHRATNDIVTMGIPWSEDTDLRRLFLSASGEPSMVAERRGVPIVGRFLRVCGAWLIGSTTLENVVKAIFIEFASQEGRQPERPVRSPGRPQSLIGAKCRG